MTEDERQQYMSEHNWDPKHCAGCDDDIKEEMFQMELNRFVGKTYNLGSNSWHTSFLDGFKMATEQEFIKFSHEYKIIWDHLNGADGKPCLKITIKTKDLGQISTEIPYEYLDTIPKNLPSQLVEAFERKFEQKRERLLKEWSKQGKSKSSKK